MHFKDFAPKMLESRLVGPTIFESFEEAVEAATRWVVEHEINVVNIETVVLPNIYREDGTTDPELTTEATADWYQFVRVWYR